MNKIIRYAVFKIMPVSIIVLLIILNLNSCSFFNSNEKYKYFSKEWVFNSPQKLKHAEYLVDQYSEHWLDTTSSYYKMCHTFSYWITPDSLFLLAVLPSITGDTVLFYPIWKVTYEDNSFSITGIPICARFDSAKITFLKPKMIFEISDENNESAFKNIGQKFKELIIKSHYLNSDNTVDPTYWFRFITDDDFFFADYKTNEKKAEILKKSKKDYFNYMLDNYYRNKAGSDFNNPIPKSDYSGWEEEYHPHWKDSIGKKRQLKTGN